mgnify:CR=1 FL=1
MTNINYFESRLYSSFSYDNPYKDSNRYSLMFYDNNGYVKQDSYDVLRKYGNIDEENINQYSGKKLSIFYRKVKKHNYIGIYQELYQLYKNIRSIRKYFCFNIDNEFEYTDNDDSEYENIIVAIYYKQDILYLDTKYVTDDYCQTYLVQV